MREKSSHLNVVSIGMWFFAFYITHTKKKWNRKKDDQNLDEKKKIYNKNENLV